MFAAPPRVNLLVLRSTDVHRAARFYRSLGLYVGPSHADNGPEHDVAVVDGFSLEIHPLDPFSGPMPPIRFGFSVDSVDGLVPLVEEFGAAVVTAPHDTPAGRRATVRDPDGHTVELVTPPHRDP